MPEPLPQVLISIGEYQRLKASDSLLRDIAKDGNATSVFAVDCVQKMLKIMASKIKENSSLTHAEIVGHLMAWASNRDGLLASLKEENGVF